MNIESRGFEHHDSIHRFHSVIASISPGNPMITLPAIGMVPLYISRSSYHIRITTLESTISPFENSKNQSISLRRFITTISLSRTRVFFLYFESKMKRNWCVERSLRGFHLRMNIWFFQILSDFIRNSDNCL